MFVELVPSTETRGYRANNLLNLSTCSITRKWGQIGEDNSMGDHLAIFPHYENGIHASLELIRKRFLFFGMFAPAPFGNKWSGDKKRQYGFTLAKMMGVSPGMPRTFKGWGDSLLRNVTILEQGNPARRIIPGFYDQFINEVMP
jgi:hypothetical protein